MTDHFRHTLLTIFSGSVNGKSSRVLLASYEQSAGTDHDRTIMAETKRKKDCIYRRVDQCGRRNYDNPTENEFVLKAEQIKQQVRKS